MHQQLCGRRRGGGYCFAELANSSLAVTNHRQYLLCLSTKGLPAWVGMAGWLHSQTVCLPKSYIAIPLLIGLKTNMLSSVDLSENMGGGQGQSGQPVGASRKLVLLSIFDTSLSSLICETCRVIQQQFWMKECDTFGVGGSKHTLIPPTYFQGSRPQLP